MHALVRKVREEKNSRKNLKVLEELTEGIKKMVIDKFQRDIGSKCTSKYIIWQGAVSFKGGEEMGDYK
jgi:hypothetical protein